MTTWPGRRLISIVLAIAFALSTLVAHQGHSPSHHPAALALGEIERHAVPDAHGDAPSDAKEDDHGHSHFDGWPGEPHSGHSPGHNPADHDHPTPTPVPTQALALLRTVDAWLGAPPSSHDNGPYFGIERPPRA